MSWTDAIGRALRRVEFRLAATIVVTLAPTVGLVIFLFYAFAASEALEEIDSRARQRLEEIGRTLASIPGSDPSSALAPLGLEMAEEGIGFAVYDAGGRTLAEGGAALERTRLWPFEQGLLAAVLPSGEDYLSDSSQLSNGRSARVTIALDHFAQERRELARGAWVSLGSGLGLAAFVALFAARRAMSPLRQATAAIERVDVRQLDERLTLRGTGDDVDRHAAAVNRVLERLESAFVRMSAFSTDVAHELRTPVNRIMNLAEVALLAGEDADGRRALEVIREAAGEMSRLVEGLLMLARGEEGRLALAIDRVGVAELLSSLERLYAPACEEQKIELALGPASGVVNADRTLLFRALANLLDNAIHFTPSGGRIRLEAALAGSAVSILVSDSGPGIPEAQREAVFERFVRLDPSRSGPGTGLGLPIARMIARIHGGDVVAAGSPLGGACFALRLPPASAPGALRPLAQR